MKYVEVNGTDLKVGDIVWDCNPQKRTDAIKFEVVSINKDVNDLILKQKRGKSYYWKREDGTIIFPLYGSPWCREEASND